MFDFLLDYNCSDCNSKRLIGQCLARTFYTKNSVRLV